MARRIIYWFIFLVCLAAAGEPNLVSAVNGDHPTFLPLINTAGVRSPVLKWQYGGCYTSSCETGWYSSPAAADTNGDGRNEVIASAYTLWALNGANGELLWRSGTTSGRTWPGVAVADIEKDGQKEIVIARGGGFVSVYRLDGSLKWQKQPAGNSNELRGLLVADLDGSNSTMEIVVTRAGGSEKNTWVLDASGNLRSGWPQLPLDSGNTNGYAWGVYNSNAAAGDLNGDSKLELVVPSDVHYINAFNPDGVPLPVNGTLYPGKSFWGQIGAWESLALEQRGWGYCDGVRAESYRANFAEGPAVIADVNGDGQREVVVTGNMYDCSTGYPPSRYMALFLFNADRSRFNAGGYDWRTIPIDTGAPLSEDYNVIETAQPNPAVADLDGDGKMEILYASYDGRVHAFWLDKTEHGSWPYTVYKPAEGFYRFASEPVVADLDNNGKAEVIFTSWTQKGSGQNGKLHVLDWSGKPLYELELPAPRSASATWNGGLAAPTLANIDADPDLELIVNTAASGVVTYDLPGTANARLLWGTGRGSFNRQGAK